MTLTAKDCILDLDEHLYQHSRKDAILFPCTAYYTDMKNDLHGELPWHWHEEIELIIVKAGSIKISLPEKSFLLNQGQGCFINSNVLHAAHTLNTNPCILHSLLFLPSLISGSLESVFNQVYIKPLIDAKHLPYIIFDAKINWQQEVLKVLNDTYYTYISNHFGFEWDIREKLSKIWILIIRNYRDFLEQTSENKNDTSNRIKTMLAFIHSNYPYSISLSNIASSANISDRECLRCFQKSLGISPMQYLIHYRIHIASTQLLETDLNITTICQAVGIESSSYFAKKFKAVKGLTPSDYRKQKI